MADPEFDIRENARKIAAAFAEKGDATGWFEELYREAAGNNEHISWADLEPNRFFCEWAEKTNLKGDGRTALVVGCGLGNDAKYLYDLGFDVTAFDISPTAVEWAKRLHKDTDIRFETSDLFQPPLEWVTSTDKTGFDFVLEVYTIQPLPLDMRPKVIDAIAAFVAPKGELVVVARGREDEEEPIELPWALSRKDLSRFEENALVQTHFEIMPAEEDEVPVPRFVVQYRKSEV